MLPYIAKIITSILSILLALGLLFSVLLKEQNAIAQDFVQIIDKTEKQIKEEQQQYQNVINQVNIKLKNLPSNHISAAVTHTNTSTNKIIQGENNHISCLSEGNEGLWIFVSHSMPNQLIIKYAEISNKLNAKLVMRGLKNNSFKETIEFIKAINDQLVQIEPNQKKDKGKSISLAIYPQVFKEFQITQVPSFVLSDGKQYDKLTGNVSLVYVLEKFSSDGDLRQKAKNYLKALKELNIDSEVFK